MLCGNYLFITFVTFCASENVSTLPRHSLNPSASINSLAVAMLVKMGSEVALLEFTAMAGSSIEC